MLRESLKLGAKNNLTLLRATTIAAVAAANMHTNIRITMAAALTAITLVCVALATEYRIAIYTGQRVERVQHYYYICYLCVCV